MKLSIVIPCYNVEPYISRCLDSIFSQELAYEFEVITVNDGSIDKTLNLLNDYKLSHLNMVVINKVKNEKLSAARSTGLLCARGDYVLNVDSDDYLLPNSLKNIFSIKNNHDVDVFIFNILIENKYNKPLLMYSENLPTIFDLGNKKDSKSLFNNIVGACYGKVIKRSIMSDLIYYNYSYNIAEDIAFNFEILNRCRWVYYSPIPIYYYCYNDTSLARGGFNIDRLDTLQSWVTNVKQVIDSCIINEYSKKKIRKIVERYSIGLLVKFSNEKDQVIRNEIWKKWVIFFEYSLSIIDRKKAIYLRVLQIKNEKLRYYLLLSLLCQMDPYKERLYRIIPFQFLRLSLRANAVLKRLDLFGSTNT